MPEEFVEVKRVGYGSKIIKSIIAIPIGIIMFIVSFVVLWTNEGRVNIGKVVETAVVLNSGQDLTLAEGKMVSVTGMIETSTPIGDPEYLKPDRYVMLKREVEMFAWVEEKETSTEKKTGGATEEKTVYRYKKAWTANPEPASEFKYPEGHENPPLIVKSTEFYSPEARIGIYAFEARSAGLPDPDPILLTNENVILPANGQLIGNEYIYLGKGSYAEPQVGDIRISFAGIRSGLNVTLFGKKEGMNIVPYLHKGKNRIYRALSGTRDEAIAQLKMEHKVMGWILRVVGFLLMWIGLTMVFAPISTVLDVLPFLGGISRGLIGIATFIVALVLSLVTIVIAMIFHNLISLIIFILLVVVLIILLSKRKKVVTG